jgi:phage-related minor tail protein
MAENDTPTIDRSGHGPEGVSIPVPRLELRRLGDEVAVALRAVTEARASEDALDALAQVTVALEQLSATQHELVAVLLDHGHTWSEVGDALSTTASAAERRFPRRGGRRRTSG